MRPKLPKSPIVIEDHDDDSESSSTDSDESEVSLSDLRERIKKNKIVERLQELYDSESSSTEEEGTAMSAGLQRLVSKLKESSQFPPLRSIKTEIQDDSQMEQNQSSVNSIKIEVESGPQTLPHVQIKEEPEDWEWEHLNDLDLAVDPGCVKTEPQEPCHHTNHEHVGKAETAEKAETPPNTQISEGSKTLTNIQPAVKQRTDKSQARQDVYRYLSDAVRSGCRVVLEEGLAIMKNEGVDICLSPLLHVAVKYDQVSVAECLLENGADPNARDKNGCDVLYKACSSCKYCSFEMVKVLLKYGATVWNNGPTTALHEAAAKGNVAVCELLIKHGADPKMRNSSGLTPLEVVLQGPHRIRTDLVCLLQSTNLASKNSNPIESEEVLPISFKSTEVPSESTVTHNNHNPLNNNTVKHTNFEEITSGPTGNDHNPLNNNTVKHTNFEEITSGPTGNDHNPLNNNTVKHTNFEEIPTEPTENEQCPVNTTTLEGNDRIENKDNISDGVSVTPTADLGNGDSEGFKSNGTKVVTGADVEKLSESLASNSNNVAKNMFHCRACKEVFFELEECTAHLVSEKHKENLRKKGYLKYKDGNRCNLCQVGFKSKNCKANVCKACKACKAKRRQHFRRKRHKEMVKWLAIDITVEGQLDDSSKGLVSKGADKMAGRTEEKWLKPVKNKEIVIHCKLCKRIFTNRTRAEIHINSAKHKRNVNCQQGNAGRGSDSTYHKCEVCQVIYTDSTQQMQHLLGKKHRSMLQWLASGCLIDISIIEQTTQASTGISSNVQSEPTAPDEGNMTGTSASVAPPTQCSPSESQSSSRKDTGKAGKPDSDMDAPPNDGGWITVGKRKAESDEDSRRKLKKFCVVSPIKHSIPSPKEGTFSSRDKASGGRKSADRKKSDKQKDTGEVSQTGYCPSVSNIKSGRDNNSPCGSKDCRMLRKSKKGSKSLHELKQKSQIMKARRKRKRKRKMKTPN